MSPDEIEVQATLVGWYTAMTAHDMTAVGDALTESFLLIEHDELLDRAQLLQMLSGETGDTIVADLSDFHVTIDGDVAWSTHRNHEVYTPHAGEPLKLEFLETVVLVRIDGRWLIDRYHATRLSPTTL
jgi:ketosteroid isomerase-like protein